MKKILAFVLALCLTLSLTVVAFAAPNSPSGGAGFASSTAGANKYSYSASTASGLPLSASVDTVTSGEIVDDLKSAGVVGAYYLSVNSAVADTEMVNVDVYAPGASADGVVVARDGSSWKVLPNVTFTVNGDRVTITAPAGVINDLHYFAIVSKWDVTDVDNPQQGTENNEENEDVDDTKAPEVDATEDTEPEDTTPAPAPAEDKNPTTGVALAVIPMIVSAAAAVISKRR